MKIETAIGVLESEVKCWCLHPEEVYPKALRLGIEALKVIDAMRHDAFYDGTEQLPRETRE